MIIVLIGGLMGWVCPYDNTPDEAMDRLGFVPDFLHPDDPRPAAEQIHDNYRHGGWKSFKAHTRMNENGELLYPGDPPLRVVAFTKLRDEVVRLHECSWVSITQPDGTFDCARID